jgi:thiamine biosynthesis lipoprotein
MIKEYEYNIKAMGTECTVSVVTTSQKLANRAHKLAHKEIDSFEERFSRFLPKSELSRLNEKKELNVSDTFLKVILKARELFIQTKGIFNPLVQIGRFGYDRDFAALRDKPISTLDEPYDVDFSTVVINQEKGRITLGEGQKLDFGGFLKGYLAERIANQIALISPDITGVIVNLGGDICTRGLDERGEKFVFVIYNPVLENEELRVALLNQSLATSGTYKRTWSQNGHSIHHILDASGLHNPTSDIISASIIHTDGAHSEAYTKVLIAVGPEAIAETLKESIRFVAIDQSGKVTSNIA